MTLVSQIITDAYRASNLLAIGEDLTTDQQDEALRYLNRLVKSSLGNEAGEQLEALPIGRNNIDQPQGFPYYNQTPQGNAWFVPKNTRLMLNLTTPLQVSLTPVPDDGTRFGVVDASNNLATNNLTIDGNGSMIEGSHLLTINVSGTSSMWFYRRDLANWMKWATLVLTDPFPFGEEFDDMFIILLAVRLNPSYGAVLDPQSQMIMNRSTRQFKSRYAQHIQTPSEIGLLRMGRVAVDRDFWNNGHYWGGDTQAIFNTGYPFG